MTKVLDFKREAVYINGAWGASNNGSVLTVTNPATGAQLGTVPDCGASETALRAWSSTHSSAMKWWVA